MPASIMKVFIGGDLLGDFSKEAILESIEVRQSLNSHWWCDIKCRQTGDQRFPVEDSLGKALHVEATDEEGQDHVLFDGFILEAELEYEIFGSFTINIQGVTQSYKMDLTPRQAYYLDASLSDVADKMVALVNLEVNLVFSPKDPPLTYTQWGETDFHFLLRLADDHKCWIRPTATGLDIIDTFQDQGTKVRWRAEEGLRQFKIKGKLGQPSMNGAQYQSSIMQSRTFQQQHADPEFFDGSTPMTDAVKKASKDNLPPGYVPQRARAGSLTSYQELLSKESVRAIGGKIVGHGVSRNEDLMPGNVLVIEGDIDAQGTYGLIQVVHRWTPSGYFNEFDCTPWKNYTNPEAPKMNRWLGMVPARVVDNNDPDGGGRVKVQYYWQEDSQTVWLRILSPHAGSDRGIYFIPEVGDEVAVAFGDGDPERPVIVGSLWNGVDKPPTEDFWGGEFASNDCKRIVTKSGHRFHFVDKPGKEAIALATPKHTKIAMFEKTDETGRPAINICCEDGDIILSAPNGRIHFFSKLFSREVGPA